MIEMDTLKKIRNWDTELTHHDEIFTANSMEYRGLYYGMCDGEFTVFKSDCYIRCPIDEVPEMAAPLKPEIRAEIMALYEDIKDLGLERVWTSEGVR